MPRSVKISLIYSPGSIPGEKFFERITREILREMTDKYDESSCDKVENPVFFQILIQEISRVAASSHLRVYDLFRTGQD